MTTTTTTTTTALWEEFDFDESNPLTKPSAPPPSSSSIMSSSASSWPKTNAASASAGTGSWEDLRKEARQLENQIDVKLVSFSKLGTNFGSMGSSSSDQAPLLNNSSDIFDNISGEIANLLARLATVNEGLTDYAAKQPQSAAIHHTLQRHRDILQDYRQEFHKTKANIEAMMEREDLLSSVHRDINDFKSNLASGSGSGSGARMDQLLRESESARTSERLLDDQINIAIETREALVNQRVVFKTIQTKLNDISNRFPLINSLVQRINLRKRRDSIIVGLVIGFCLLFMLWYALG